MNSNSDSKFGYRWWHLALLLVWGISIGMLAGYVLSFSEPNSESNQPKEQKSEVEPDPLEEDRATVAECHAKAAIQNYEGRYVVDECWMSGDGGAHWTKIYYGGDVDEQL